MGREGNGERGREGQMKMKEMRDRERWVEREMRRGKWGEMER